MIIIKLILLCFILAASSYLGRMIAGSYKARVEELKEFKNGLTMFETKIKFTYEPIPELFKEISNSLTKNIGAIFENASKLMQTKSAKESWEEAVSKSRTSLTKEDISVIKKLSKLLGKTDLNGQVSEIELTKSFLDTQIEKAEKECHKNMKLYRTLGVVSGLALVIILL